MLEPLLIPPTPQPRLSLLNGHEEPLYENLLSPRTPEEKAEEEPEAEEMASSSSNSRLTGIPVLLKRSHPQSSFLHSTYRPTSVYRPPMDNKVSTTTAKRNTTCLARPSRTRPNGSVDSDSSSSRCSSDSLVINNQDKQEIPPQMVATLAGQFNALIERRKAQQQHLQQVDSRLNFQLIKKPVEVKKTVRSCPSSPQPVSMFTRGKWGSVGHPGNKCRGTVMTPDRPPFTSSTESCDSGTLDQRSPSTEEVKLTAVQRAARNYEVALKKTTSSSFSALSAITTTKVTKTSSVDSWKTRPTVKPPELPPTRRRQLTPEPPLQPVKDEQQSASMDLLAEIDRHLKSKESVNVLIGNGKEPNPSFLWKNTTQRRFEKVEQEDVNDDVVDEEEHLYEELTHFFSSRKNERLDVPLAMPENDSSSSSSSYGYAAASLSYSVARCSFKSNSSSTTNKETLTEADAESDGGSWADDSDDEGQQWCKTKPSRRTWSKNARDETKGSRSEVQSGGEGLWEDDGGAAENIYNEPLTEAEVRGGGGGTGGKKVKRNWSWSKTRTEFHLDISSKLGRIRPTNANNKKSQNPQVNKWPFKGNDVNKVNRKCSPTEKEASAQFYIPSSSSSSESKVNLESVGRRAKRLSNAGSISRPTTAPPLPPGHSGGGLPSTTAKEDDDSSSTGISSRSCESVSLAKDHEEEEPKRFLYLDDTYYIDEDHKKLSPFDNEPLYQFYTMAAQQRAAHENQVDSSDDDCYESLYQVTSVVEDDGSTDVKASDDDQAETKMSNVPSAMELVRLTEGGVRTLWCEVPEVVASGVLNTITVSQRNVQEAMFEVITSEASYLKSLNILINHFMMCPMFLHEFASDCVLSKRERHVLFSDVVPVRETSERLLEALERRWQESIVIKDICDILLVHATKYFDVYVKYCSNQLYQDRCLKKLKESNSEFVDVLRRLESNSMCQGLSMYSFLMLPMQRITRLPLLVDAIFHRLDTDSPNYDTCKQALATLNKIVHECNEGAQRMARMEEMLNISRQLDFRMFKGLALISASRWLVKQGELVRLLLGDSCKLSFVRNRCPKQVVHLFLFTDILIVTKKKGDDCYHVVDYSPRNMLQVTEGPDQLPDRLLPDGCRNLFQLTMLQNHDGKTVEMFFTCPMESDRTRWVEAIAPKRSDDPDERIYEEWDCPQVQAIHNYTAQQPDELSLEESDVVNVFRKMADGWYQGERIRDGSKGWFPSNYTLEIVSSHVRARNLRQRYRLLALSQSYLEEQRKKEAKI